MAYNDRQRKYERASARRFNSALRQQAGAVVNWITEENIIGLEIAIPLLVKPEPIRKAMQSVYVNIAPNEAVAMAREVDRNLPNKSKKVNGIGFFSEYWKRWMMEAYLTLTSDLITNITETTRDKIRQLMSNAREQNLSYRDMARYMKAELNRPDFTSKRALTIARTESTRAANLGQMQVGKDSNLVLDKKWHHSAIRDYRESHLLIAREDPIPIDQPFIIEGIEMMQPGDPSAPAEQTVQCKCSLSFVPRLDADGLPITRETGLERELFA